ncbi:MAG: hypothetical protein K8I60_08130 [Anaerolineae bacterium]|nr:hypothetical protein [Anaerolineae bacterium]
MDITDNQPVPRDELPTDPDSLARWENLPHNEPSRESLPPAAGGTRWVRGLLLLLLFLMILGLLLQSGAGH